MKLAVIILGVLALWLTCIFISVAFTQATVEIRAGHCDGPWNRSIERLLGVHRLQCPHRVQP